MSLRQLLPIGRAFKPVADRSGRYRPSDPGVLPEFGITGSAAAPAPEKLTKLQTTFQTTLRTALPSDAPNAISPPRAMATNRPAAAPAPRFDAAGPAEAPTGTTPAETSLLAHSRVDGDRHSPEPGAKKALLGGASFLPTTSRSRSGRGSRGRRLPEWLEQVILAVFCPGNRRRGTRPVQTEMAFEAVKVVRNDLTTADVEVVVRPAAKPPRPLSAGCRTRLLRLWWTEGANRVRKLGGLLF